MSCLDGHDSACAPPDLTSSQLQQLADDSGRPKRVAQWFRGGIDRCGGNELAVISPSKTGPFGGCRLSSAARCSSAPGRRRGCTGSEPAPAGPAAPLASAGAKSGLPSFAFDVASHPSSYRLSDPAGIGARGRRHDRGCPSIDRAVNVGSSERRSPVLGAAAERCLDPPGTRVDNALRRAGSWTFAYWGHSRHSTTGRPCR